MGIFDKAKDLIEEHDDQVKDGIDKVADFIEDKAGEDRKEQIENVAEKAKDAVNKLTED